MLMTNDKINLWQSNSCHQNQKYQNHKHPPHFLLLQFSREKEGLLNKILGSLC